MDRSENMRRIRSKNTTPELAVRRLLRALGHTGYRLHRKDLPGCPDVVFIGRRKAILVHGCFWHGHSCKKGGGVPKSNQQYWEEKIRGNRERDRRNLRKLRSSGWSALAVWECELSNEDALANKVDDFLNSRRGYASRSARGRT